MKRERNSVIFTLHETSCNILFSKLKIHGLQMAYHEDDHGSRTLRAFPRFSFFSSSYLKTKLKLLLCFIITNNGRKLSINTWMELYNSQCPVVVFLCGQKLFVNISWPSPRLSYFRPEFIVKATSKAEFVGISDWLIKIGEVRIFRFGVGEGQPAVTANYRVHPSCNLFWLCLSHNGC